MRNNQVADILDRLGDLVEANGEDRFKVIAYHRAATSIRNLETDIEQIRKEGKLEDIQYVGHGISEKIDEYLKTGRLGILEGLQARVPAGVPQLMKVQGIGPRTAYKLSHDHGITSVPELQKALREGRLSGEFSARVSDSILKAVERLESYEKRMLLPEAEGLFERLDEYFASHRVKIGMAGSLRRGKSTIGDIDILSKETDAGEILAGFPLVEKVLERGPKRASVKLKDGVQVDVRIFGESEYGAALLYFTGSKDHGIALRSIAIEKGWKLNEYGLFDEKTDRRVAGRTEEETYQELGLVYIPPELRENRGEIEAASKNELPSLLKADDIKADLQMHSTWSDGSEEVESMAKGAMAKGYEYMAVTDHSVSVRVANGLSEERFRRQWKAIDNLNEKLSPFRILKGAEVEIKSDGSPDFDRKFLDELDVVGVSLHQSFKQSPEKLTERAVRALSHPSVDFMCHPTNRLLGRREGHQLDMKKLIQTAKDNGKMLEIDGEPQRLDLDEVWAKRAMEQGVPIMIDSDAHSAGELDNINYGVLVARRAWLEAKHVANTRTLKQFLRLIL